MAREGGEASDVYAFKPYNLGLNMQHLELRPEYNKKNINSKNIACTALVQILHALQKIIQVSTWLRGMANLPFGLCAITSLGSFDHKRGGHLILWQCWLVMSAKVSSDWSLKSRPRKQMLSPTSVMELQVVITDWGSWTCGMFSELLNSSLSHHAQH